METKYAWTTLLTSEDYIRPVLNLYYSLRRVHSKYPLIIIVSDSIAFNIIPELERNHCQYYIVPDLNRMSEKPRTFTIDMLMKFYSFELTDYKKVCYLDGDILIIKNCDFVFNFRAPAAKYLGWDYRPIHKKVNPGEQGILAGEVMLLEPGTFSMEYFFSKESLEGEWDEAILRDNCGIQRVTNLPLSDTNYLWHAHITGNNNKYWEKCEIYSEDGLDDFLDRYSINGIQHAFSDFISCNSQEEEEEEEDNDNN